MPFPRASQALSRFTVLDLTRVRSGPTCVRQLADWGANVIKIDALEDAAGEQPGGPRHGSDFQNLHRNKRAMTLNLKDKKGLEVFQRLAEKADVNDRHIEFQPFPKPSASRGPPLARRRGEIFQNQRSLTARGLRPRRAPAA